MDESVPLLPQRIVARDGREAAENKHCGAAGATRWWRDLAREGGKVGRVALPMAAVSLSQYAVQVASNMMVGHLPGVLPLSASAIATSLATVSGFSLLIGMASGLETLCGQAYGAKQYDTLGLQTYRAIVTLIVVSVPISLLWLFIGKLLILIGQDPLISKETGRYIAWLIPGLFAYAVSQPLTKFLQSQSLIIPMLWSSVATLLLHIPLCWLLVFKTSLGFIGASLAISLSYWLNVIMLAAYIRYSSACKETRSPPTVEAFKGVGVFLHLALPSALMLCFEWWSFEILILVSGLLPNPELQTSVLSICLTTITLMYTIPYGLGAAASTRVANELGAGNPEGARSAVRIVMTIATLEASMVTSSLLASQHIVGYAYSGDKEVVGYVNAMVPFICVSVAADSLQGVLSANLLHGVCSFKMCLCEHGCWCLHQQTSGRDVTVSRLQINKNCPRIWVAALRRLCEPRFFLSGRDSSGAIPRLCSEDGRKRAVDGHFLRFRSAVLTPRRDNILQQLAKDV